MPGVKPPMITLDAISKTGDVLAEAARYEID
jgi:hypothetical protein